MLLEILHRNSSNNLLNMRCVLFARLTDFVEFNTVLLELHLKALGLKNP